MFPLRTEQEVIVTGAGIEISRRNLLKSGVVFGTAAMLDGLCDRMEQELGRKVKSFVATGGLSGEIIKSCNHKMTYDPELILKGLRIIYEKNRK